MEQQKSPVDQAIENLSAIFREYDREQRSRAAKAAWARRREQQGAK